jgi:hypothetical protein
LGLGNGRDEEDGFVRKVCGKSEGSLVEIAESGL